MLHQMGWGAVRKTPQQVGAESPPSPLLSRSSPNLSYLYELCKTPWFEFVALFEWYVWRQM